MARTAKPKSDVNRNVVSLKLTLRGTETTGLAPAPGSR